ncbi:hypothetical protein DFH08DRAFT_812304 [Mycena albidolilacea]|uniref:Uncharacterized protein n=1 Tax=Mycena albidolilacea TaxID=1033008 RepID=A0AAD6ZVM2_9AGAR|nr:hypothetical protein DFH08DRAFT_812304 [Mycena albidolilacea]
MSDATRNAHLSTRTTGFKNYKTCLAAHWPSWANSAANGAVAVEGEASKEQSKPTSLMLRWGCAQSRTNYLFGQGGQGTATRPTTAGSNERAHAYTGITPNSFVLGVASRRCSLDHNFIRAIWGRRLSVQLHCTPSVVSAVGHQTVRNTPTGIKITPVQDVPSLRSGVDRVQGPSSGQHDMKYSQHIELEVQ